MTETVLSYLGLGITDPAVSWGSLIKRDLSTIANLRAFPWLLSPVWFLLGVTLGFNFIGDALRDFFDPYHIGRLENRGRVGGFIRRILRSPQLPASQYSASNSPLLEIKDLAVDFSVLRGKELVSVKTVRGLSLTIQKGETLGIVGESGSGKSVSTLAIPGLLPGNAKVNGSILWEGNDLAVLGKKELREYRGKKIGMIFQEPGRSFDPLQNIGKVFLETFRNSEPEITKEEAAYKACALLEETGLDNGQERLSNFPHQFSGGQLQRIGIALALAQGCELLIADEPTTALDLTIQKQIILLLKDLYLTRKLSIIFISHDIDLTAEISASLMVMYGGLVMESGVTREIIDNPRHPYTSALLAASPRFGSHYSKERLITIPGKVSDPANPEPGCPFAPRCSQAKPECTRSIPALRQETDKNGNFREIRCIIAKKTSEN
jgi:peptide/nickel transport system permease protein